MIIYNVNEEKRTIVAMYEFGAIDVKSSLYHMIDNLENDCASIAIVGFDASKVLDKYEKDKRFEIVGIAKCHEEDTWDENKGKEIAKQRLNRQFAILKNEILRELEKRLNHDFRSVYKRILAKLFRKSCGDVETSVSYKIKLSYEE